jgi:chemotaxis protein MotB
MSDSLLHKMMGQMGSSPPSSRPASGAFAASSSASAGLAANGGSGAGAEPLHSGRQGGRFARWHVETPPPQEDEAWLIAYLDVVTLLLAMMVVMLAFSEPVSESFRGENREIALDKASPVVQTASDSGTSIVQPVPLPYPATAPAKAEGPPVDSQPGAAQTGLPIGDLGNQIQVDVGRGVVRFRISSEVLFASGDSALTPAGQQVMDRLLPAFNQAQDHSILVEGHTDNVPISTTRFPSNWELAATRAGSVVRHLESRGLNPTRLRATGLSDTRPLVSNATPEGRAANRRVEITMEAPPELR